MLDFGLAKAIGGDDSTTFLSRQSGLTTHDTHVGMVVGTPAYMSPEQVRGQSLDKRTDVWAFGCLLFEMLSGRPAFQQSTMSDTLDAVVGREPDWNRLPSTLPRTLLHLLKKCLAKDVRQRLRSVADAGLDLEDDVLRQQSDAPSRMRNALFAAGVAAAILGIGGVIRWMRPGPTGPTNQMPQTVQLTTYTGSELSPSISPDGSQFAFAWNGASRENFHIYIKRFDGGEPVPLSSGRSDDLSPVWSPDGTSVAFVRFDTNNPRVSSSSARRAAARRWPLKTRYPIRLTGRRMAGGSSTSHSATGQASGCSRATAPIAIA